MSQSIVIVALILGGLFIGLWFLRGLRRAGAANNVVAAIATFATLSDADQSLVVERAEAIIRRSSWPVGRPITFPTDVARWGWYALSMRELGIPPVCLNSSWVVVRNPFTALLVTDTMLDTSIRLAQKAGHAVSLSREPGLFAQLARK